MSHLQKTYFGEEPISFNPSAYLQAAYKIQWKPLNVITLGQTESDNINRLITLTADHFYS
jgi:hypothetical protein